MIVGYVTGQLLDLHTPVVVADSVNYLSAQFVFRQREWDGLDMIRAVFTLGDMAYTLPLTDGKILPEDGLNLEAGQWAVHLVGSQFVDGILTQRITTNTADLLVKPTGAMDGEPLPPIPATETERLWAEIELLKKQDNGVAEEKDPTVPEWAKQPQKPSYTAEEVGARPSTWTPTAEDVGALPVGTKIPTKTSDLNNDAGFITGESDPTVPAWAKQANKPSYTATEVGALPESTKIPAKTSDLNNDSGFITKAVSDLTNYYSKSQTLSKEEINALVSSIPKFSISVVSSLPTSGISTTTIYLVKSGSGGDLYTEYIYTNGAWEILGSQRVDLTGYATETWVNAKLTDYLTADKLTAAIVQSALGYTPAKESAIPTKVSQLENDSGYAKKTDVDSLAAEIADLQESKANAIVESATGESIAVSDSADAPLRGLVVYGKSTQDGTPAPDAPVDIVSVGVDGTTTATISGKNFFDPSGLLKASGWKEADGVYSGANNALHTLFSYGAGGYMQISTGGRQVTFSLDIYADEGGGTSKQTYFSLNYEDGTRTLISMPANTEPKHYKLTSVAGKKHIVVGLSYGSSVVIHISNIQLEFGATETAYEPYTAQTLPISTPDGLCGIPVSSGGNYTDANGQMWICDTVDFVRGVRVQRVGKIGSYNAETIDTPYISTTGGLDTGAEVLYVLPAAIETPLTEEELAAYAALRMNYPNTTIYADDNAGLAVQYKADTKAYIDKKFDALAAAVVAGA